MKKNSIRRHAVIQFSSFFFITLNSLEKTIIVFSKQIHSHYSKRKLKNTIGIKKPFSKQ